MHLIRPVALVAIAVAMVVLAWPRPLGGATSYVVVSGVSMEPTYETGDLVVARESGNYEVGDVIAFRTEEGDVIHRIIGGDAEAGFQTQGDNVERPDPYLPRPADIRGRAVLHVPALGAWGLRLVQTVPAPLLAAGAILLALSGERGRRRCRQRPTRVVPHVTPPREDAMSTTVLNQPRVRTAAICVVAAVVVLPSVLLAWRAPATVDVSAAEAPQRHVVQSTVTGIAKGQSTLYPTGRSEPITAPTDAAAEDATGGGATLLRSLIDEVEVAVRHELVGGELTSGAARIDVRMVTGRGFEIELQGLPMTTFSGPFEGVVTVDFAEVDRRLAEYLAEAGLSHDTVVVEVERVIATDDGTTMQGQPVVLRPTDEVIEVAGSLRTVTTPEGAATTVSATTPLLGIRLPVLLVRVLGTGIVVGLLAFAFLLLGREMRDRPDLRIGLLHGSLLVQIERDANVGGDVVRVSSMAELVRLARRDQRSILHQERADGTHRYLVPDGDLTYEYVVQVDHQPAAPTAFPVPDDAATLAGSTHVDTPRADPPDTSTADDAATPDEPGVAARATAPPIPVSESDDSPSPGANGEVRDYLVSPTELSPGRIVVVEDFAELTRVWMRDNAAPGRLQRRRLADGGIRYSVIRNGREFVYDAAADEDVVASARGRRG